MAGRSPSRHLARVVLAAILIGGLAIVVFAFSIWNVSTGVLVLFLLATLIGDFVIFFLWDRLGD